MIRNLVQVDHSKLPKIAFHSMNLCDDFIVIYGGLSAAPDKICGDLIFLRSNKNKFMIASYVNNQSYFPKPRYSHMAVYYSKKRKLFIFGGIINDNPRYTNELWSLDVSTKPIFTALEPTGISIRCKAAGFICRDFLYIYGGFGINKITQKYQILNELFKYDLNYSTTSEIQTKGGIDMNNFLFNVTRLTEERENPEEDLKKEVKFGFFCSDLTQFFIFDIDTQSFTKIIPKFFIHNNRENFTVNRLSDGRIILFGGISTEDSGEKITFNELFALISFNYTQKDKIKNVINNEIKNESEINEVHYSWNDIDIYGSMTQGEGYNGHASVVLPNDHIFIFGGAVKSYFPVYNANTNDDPIFTSRSKIIDVFNSYKWELPTNKSANKLHIYPRILHVSHIIPAENKSSSSYLFFHGGDFDQRLLCHYSLFDLDKEEWVQVKNDESCPQIKSHACSYINDPYKKEFHIIMAGGIYKEHMGNCEAVTGKMKEKCGCQTELVSDKIYSYRNHKFEQIDYNINEEYVEKMKRYGHNMLAGADNSIYIICGYAQYIGYLIDIIKLKPKLNLKTKKFYFDTEYIDINKSVTGRMHATCQIVQSNIIIFGGVKDERTLNDLWVINLNSVTAFGVTIPVNWIYPRFGMSSVINIQPHDNKSIRLIIFGGSYWTGKELVYGVTNEIVVFNIQFTDESFTDFDVVKILPCVYGKGSRRIFHTANFYKNLVYIFGGYNNLILRLKIADTTNLVYENNLDDYVKEYPLIHYTSLLHSQEHQDNVKFQTSSNIETSKLSSVKNESLKPNSKSNVLQLKETKGGIELISLEKNKSLVNQSAIEEISVDSGRKKLILEKNKKNKDWEIDYL